MTGRRRYSRAHGESNVTGRRPALLIVSLTAVALLTACVAGGDFDRPALAGVAAATDTTATELADVLVRNHGVPFQEAHSLVAKAVAHCRSRGVALLELTADELHELGGPRLSEAELHQAVSPESFIARRSGFGGPAPEVVKAQLERAQNQLKSREQGIKTVRNTLSRAFHALRVPGKDYQ